MPGMVAGHVTGLAQKRWPRHQQGRLAGSVGFMAEQTVVAHGLMFEKKRPLFFLVAAQALRSGACLAQFTLVGETAVAAVAVHTAGF